MSIDFEPSREILEDERSVYQHFSSPRAYKELTEQGWLPLHTFARHGIVYAGVMVLPAPQEEEA